MSSSALMPKSMSSSQIDLFICDHVHKAKPYILDRIAESVSSQSSLSSSRSLLKLDQNELHWAWPESFKTQVTENLKSRAWHLYPHPYATELEDRLAQYHHLAAGSILLSHTSSSLIDLMYSSFSPCNKWVILNPTFGLYDSKARIHNLNVTPWFLHSNGGFRPDDLADLESGSCVIFTSPNNPTGCVLDYDVLDHLLGQHSDCLFICDAAYEMFSGHSTTPLLQTHSNLIILQTFSKAFGSAGVRLAYLLGSPHTLNLMRSLHNPYCFNYFSLAMLDELLTPPYTLLSHLADHTKKIARLRDELYQKLVTSDEFYVYPSGGNFLLLRFPNLERCEQLYQYLKDHGIIVRNLSGGSRAALRVTISSAEHNAQLYKTIQQFFTS